MVRFSGSLLYSFLETKSGFFCFPLHQVFHLRDVEERPPFLSKSFLGFLAFNVITYSLLIAELVITNTQIHSEEDKVRKLQSDLSLNGVSDLVP